jgi:hypothetical protein
MFSSSKVTDMFAFDFGVGVGVVFLILLLVFLEAVLGVGPRLMLEELGDLLEFDFARALDFTQETHVHDA